MKHFACTVDEGHQNTAEKELIIRTYLQKYAIGKQTLLATDQKG